MTNIKRTIKRERKGTRKSKLPKIDEKSRRGLEEYGYKLGIKQVVDYGEDTEENEVPRLGINDIEDGYFSNKFEKKAKELKLYQNQLKTAREVFRRAINRGEDDEWQRHEWEGTDRPDDYDPMEWDE